MCLLLETIKVKQNSLQHLEFHNERVNYSRRKLFQSIDAWDLAELITVPELNPAAIYKCRVIYSQGIHNTEFLPYSPRKIEKLILVSDNDITYPFKYANRDVFDRLKKNMAIAENADILIVKNGFVTDTSFSNIAFFDGNKWFTPSTPLLKGTKREFYLKKDMISARHITPFDIHDFQKARLINAMLDLEDDEDIMIENIVVE